MDIPRQAQGTWGTQVTPGIQGIRGAEYAEACLVEAAERLEQAKLAALLGIHYDPDEFDQLIVEHRRARRYADSVRRLAVQLSSFAICGRQPTPSSLGA